MDIIIEAFDGPDDNKLDVDGYYKELIKDTKFDIPIGKDGLPTLKAPETIPFTTKSSNQIDLGGVLLPRPQITNTSDKNRYCRAEKPTLRSRATGASLQMVPD